MKILGAVYLSVYLAISLPVTYHSGFDLAADRVYKFVHPGLQSSLLVAPVFSSAAAPHLYAVSLRGWKTKLEVWCMSFVLSLVAMWHSFFLREFLKCHF